jgi:cysteine-rich repeat protein
MESTYKKRETMSAKKIRKKKHAVHTREHLFILILLIIAAVLFSVYEEARVSGQYAFFTPPKGIETSRLLTQPQIPPDRYKVPKLYPKCGNGKINTNEMCDDENVKSGDGCSKFCVIESPKNPQYYPLWYTIPPTSTIVFPYNAAQSALQNGDGLKDAIETLQPGQKIEVEGGNYEFTSSLDIMVQGTSNQPIWIVNKPGETPIITQTTTSAAILEIGEQGGGGQARYLGLKGFEVTGGDIAIRIHKASNIVVDDFHIHDTGDGGIKSRTENADHLYVINNEIHDTSGYGEGIVIGLSSSRLTRDSVYALNTIYNTYQTSSGDGIELRFGSHSNWIAENIIHDTFFPCIQFDFAQQGKMNVIERNVVYDCGDNGIQAQGGRALVYNNLIVGDFGNKGFDSSHNAATLENLWILHNTIIDRGGYGAGLNGWSNQPGNTVPPGQDTLHFANNVIYVRQCGTNGYSINIGNGAVTTATIDNNVVYSQNGCSPGSPGSSGVINIPLGTNVVGTGSNDFVNVASLNAGFTTIADYIPTPGGPIEQAGAPKWSIGYDILKVKHNKIPESGVLVV